MTNKKRLNFPDSVKGLAVLLMIQVHLMELFAKEEIFNGSLGLVSLFFGGIPAAPVFMGIMGYFLAFGQKSPVSMSKRGVRLFLGGILLNIGLNAHLLYNIYFKSWEVNPLHYIFGVDILPLAGLSLISLALVQKLASNKYWIYFILAIAIAGLSSLFSPAQFEQSSFSYILAFLVGGTSWSYFPLIPWLAYPLLGYGFKIMADQINIETFIHSIWSKVIFGLIGIVLLFTADFGLRLSTDLIQYYHHNISFFLWSTAFVIFWVYALFLLNKVAENTVFFIYFQFLGKNVTTIYVFQWLIIGNLGTALYKSQNIWEWVFWIFNITILSSVLTYLWTQYRIKYSIRH